MPYQIHRRRAILRATHFYTKQVSYDAGGAMGKVFETATKVAIREILENHTQTSKFGYFLSEDSLTAAAEDLFELIETSRTLKAAGDRYLSSQLPPERPRNKPLR